MYVVPSAYKIMLSRNGVYTKRFLFLFLFFFLAGEQTNSVITYQVLLCGECTISQQIE